MVRVLDYFEIEVWDNRPSIAPSSPTTIKSMDDIVHKDGFFKITDINNDYIYISDTNIDSIKSKKIYRDKK